MGNNTELDVLYNHMLRLAGAHCADGLQSMEEEYIAVMRDLVAGGPAKPVVVELGMRHGISTIALLHGAAANGGVVHSIDIDEACGVILPAGLPFQFHCMDSIEAASELGLRPNYVLVDSDHTYEYTLAEIRAWWPILEPEGMMFFHDSFKVGGVWKAIVEAELPVWRHYEEKNNLVICKKL